MQQHAILIVFRDITTGYHVIIIMQQHAILHYVFRDITIMTTLQCVK